MNNDMNIRNEDIHYLPVAICDDEQMNLSALKELTERCLSGTKHKIFTYTESSNLLEDVLEKQFSLIIMDIQLKGANGILIAKQIRSRNPYCSVIFVSHYLSYAQDVYDVDHVAFVTKQDMDYYLPKAIDKLLRKPDAHEVDNFSVNTDQGWVIIPGSKIIYMERVGRKTALYMERDHQIDEIFTKEKLEDVLQRLGDIRFIQCHKSYAYNWQYVKSFAKDTAYLKNGLEIPISRKKIADVQLSFQKWSL